MITQTNAKAIFLQALELITVTDRDAFLDTQCGSDADLRREVDELLLHHRDVGSFLESPPTAVVESAEQLRTIAHETPSLEFLQPSTRADSLGRLAHYEILEIVGSGGMGIVLKAFDEQLHRVVAIKAMNAPLAASATGRQRFVREAQAAAAVNHDNVVDIYAVDETGPVPYLVMEYIAGISLEDKLAQHGPLELKEILRIGLQTADGLAAAHRQGLVHRDVKPANILLENGVGRVKITDFGLARAIDDVSVTQSGIIAGTPAYMSPEQARGETVDHRSDLFSLGSVLYVLCCGRTPFRSSTSLGLLSHVCQEQPHPIRDLNPDIPEWLCAIVQRLHAKRPAERFQSAAELAETLGGCLAHVQQPSLPLPTAMDSYSAPQQSLAPVATRKAHHVRRYVVAALAALILLGLTLSLTDASGITHVAATVIRIFTPHGTLIVEVDDAEVKVTIEGDGGIVITGAGPQEVRLRPGSYKVRATKDGKVLKTELVTIARAGKEVVKVSLEPSGHTQAASSDLPPLAPGEIRRFEGHTHPLNGVAFSSDGRYVVTASGNPTHVQSDPPGERDDTVRLWDVKTGKELRRFVGHGLEVVGVAISRDGRRILSGANDNTVRLWEAQTGQEIRQFKGHTAGVTTVAFSPDGRYAASAGGGNDGKGRIVDCDVHLWEVESGKELRRFKGHTHQIRNLDFSPDGRHLLTGSLSLDDSMRLWDVETGDEVRRFKGHTHWVVGVAFSRDGRHAVSASFDKTVRVWEVATGREVKRFEVPQLVVSVAYSPDGRRVLAGTQLNLERARSAKEEVMYLWDLQTGKELRRYEGRYVAISPDGRQALSGSAAGSVRLWDLPEQVAETQAFVVLGGKGIEVRKFDTLAEAVRGASDGDTIEVRGNGPFVTKSINLGTTALTIRAGAGFRPVIKLSSADHQAVSLLESRAPLVLEGLELQRLGNEPALKGEWWVIVYSYNAPLHVANCRFVARRIQNCISADSPDCALHNCEILCPETSAVVWGNAKPGARLVIDNCVQAPGHIIIAAAAPHGKGPNVFQLSRNTCLTQLRYDFELEKWQGELKGDERIKLLRVAASGNVLDASSTLFDLQLDKVAPVRETEAFLDHRVDWRGESNLFATSGSFLSFGAPGKAWEPTIGINSLADWKKFWGSAEAGSIEGQPRYQGGDLRSKLREAPEKVTPEDFRLRPDSPGYRAGKDGKDLGADVDLVGPGPAYERWKQTPEYQQWLKDTGRQN